LARSLGDNPHESGYPRRGTLHKDEMNGRVLHFVLPQ
jgi:hypothetical protein